MSVTEGAPQGYGEAGQSGRAAKERAWPLKRWLGSGRGGWWQHAPGREVPTEAQGGQSPFLRPAHPPPVSGYTPRATLCQEESLPGHRGSPGVAMRRMSALSAGRAVLLGPLPARPLHKDTPLTRPLPRSAVATATGLQTQSAVYSQPCARKLSREAARRTSLGGGGREPVIGR